MNLAELLKATYAPLRDRDRVRFDEDDVVDLLNDAYIDIAMRTELLVREETGTTSGDTITIPDGTSADPLCVRILSLRVGIDDVEFTDDATWFSHSDAGSSPSHVLGRIDADSETVVLYPAPSSGTAFVLEYVWVPSGTTAATRRLDDQTDIPALPVHLHRKLVYFAQAECYEIAGEGDLAVNARQKFEQGLPAPPLGRPAIAPSPDSLLVVPGPFDRSTSRHI